MRNDTAWSLVESNPSTPWSKRFVGTRLDVVSALIVLDDLEAADGFVFGIFDDEVAVIFGPVVEFEETVFAGAGTEEHAVVFVGTGNGLDVEVEKGVGGIIAGWQAMADEEAEVAVDRVLRWGDKGRPNPAVGKARTSNLEEEFLREVAEVGDVFCAVADLEDFELGAVAEVEGGASGCGDEE